ncbi:MAG TPA: ROK family protein [Candidatus Hydrogenedentes bacterium]|nr:ROK family protein [Candidatus Hydrogenedentota bacterium]
MNVALNEGDFVVGLDIGGTKMMACVFDHQFKVVGRCKKKSKSAKDEKPEARIARIVREALDDSGNVTIRGIGVGSPGPLDPDTGVIIDTPNLGWKKFPLAKVLSDAFEVPVAVDNDVNLGTLGEWVFGKVKDCKHVVGLFPGTGIGGGIIIDGKLLHGASGSAGEVGHMTLEIDGPYCGCGKRGCFEALASRVAVAAQIAALAARGDAPYILQTCGTDIAKIRSGAIAKAIDEGEKMVEGVVRKAAFYTGVAAANLINTLSPEALVLGGGLVEAMPNLYMEEVTKALKQHTMPFLLKFVRVMPAKLGDDAVAMGAAALITDRLNAT